MQFHGGGGADERGSPNNPIIISGDNWCPVNCGEDAVEKGILIKTAIEAFKKLGLKWTIHSLKLKKFLNTGNVHCACRAHGRDPMGEIEGRKRNRFWHKLWQGGAVFIIT